MLGWIYLLLLVGAVVIIKLELAVRVCRDHRSVLLMLNASSTLLSRLQGLTDQSIDARSESLLKPNNRLSYLLTILIWIECLLRCQIVLQEEEKNVQATSKYLDVAAFEHWDCLHGIQCTVLCFLVVTAEPIDQDVLVGST